MFAMMHATIIACLGDVPICCSNPKDPIGTLYRFEAVSPFASSSQEMVILLS